MERRRLAPWVAACILLSDFAPAQTRAEQEPLWEIGAGLAALDFPVYRGSNERKSYLLPVPFLNYNGETLQINRRSARALILRRDRVEMDISVNGSVPASSKDARARSRMPNLDSTIEIGPQLKFHLYYDENKASNFDLRIPLRPAIASDFHHFQDIGWVFQPQMNLDLKRNGWNIGLVAGPVYADQRYNQYFYNVAPQFATPTRPAYTARGGYSGFQFIAALSKRFPGYWTGGFMKWDNLGGAVFSNSPLITSKHYFTVGWTITWVLGRSEQMVEVNND